MGCNVIGIIKSEFVTKTLLDIFKNLIFFSLLEPSIDLCFNGITTNQHAVFFGHKVNFKEVFYF